MADPTDCGNPIAYLVLEAGATVYAADQSAIGTVKHVLFVEQEDVFDGIVIETGAGERFVDSSDVDRIYERCVFTTLTPQQAAALPQGEGGSPTFEADPAAGAGHSLRDYYLRLFGKGGWVEK